MDYGFVDRVEFRVGFGVCVIDLYIEFFRVESVFGVRFFTDFGKSFEFLGRRRLV